MVLTVLLSRIFRDSSKAHRKVWDWDIEFLRHIERTRVMIHIVDAASTEGRDPVDDVYKINAELKAYNADIASRPQVIAANKVDVIYR